MVETDYLWEYRSFWLPRLSQEQNLQMAVNKIFDFDFTGDEEVYEALRAHEKREDRIGERIRKILKKLGA